MFSFDLNEPAAAANGLLDRVHVYIGNPGSEVSSGIAYESYVRGRQLENSYFFDGQHDQREIVEKTQYHVFSKPWQLAINDLYRPELRDCHTVFLANKRACDMVYFSGVYFRQLLFFVQWQA